MIELVCLLSLGFMSNNLQSGERNISGVGLFSGISSPSLVSLLSLLREGFGDVAAVLCAGCISDTTAGVSLKSTT
jgi:hypothetical protein